MGQAERADAALRRRARGDRTRVALTDAALALFDTKGVEGTAVDEITAAAAVAKGTFYVHFQRKEDVLLERAAQLTLEVGAATPTDPSEPVEALGALCARVSATLSAEPRVLIGRAVRELVGHREHWLRVLGDRPTLGMIAEPIVAAGQRQGVLRTDQSARRLAQALTILLLDNVIGWAERPDERPLAYDLERALALFLDGAITR